MQVGKSKKERLFKDKVVCVCGSVITCLCVCVYVCVITLGLLGSPVSTLFSKQNNRDASQKSERNPSGSSLIYCSKDRPRFWLVLLDAYSHSSLALGWDLVFRMHILLTLNCRSTLNHLPTRQICPDKASRALLPEVSLGGNPRCCSTLIMFQGTGSMVDVWYLH